MLKVFNDKTNLNTMRVFIIMSVFAVAWLLLTFRADAWTTSVSYAGGNQTWDADHGFHRAQVEWNNGSRYIRAGDDYVRWNTYQGNGSGHPAMVYHAFATNSNNCGNIRVGLIGWSWSNLPQYRFTTKRTCWSGDDNEWRAHIDGTIATGTNYYFQHLFKDTNNNVGTGEITVDSYWINWGGTPSYHGKICVNSSNVYAPGANGC